MGGGVAPGAGRMTQRQPGFVSLYTVVLMPVAALVFAGVAVTLVFALVRYRERRNSSGDGDSGNTRLEMA